MQKIQNIGKISQFFSVCIQAVFEGSKIIDEVHKSKNQQIEWKGINDPVTIADIKVQQLLVNSIRKYWPKIKIIGEENVNFEGKIDFDYGQLNPDWIDEKLFQSGKNNFKINNEFDLDNVVVFVDPLDGTLSYTKNELDAVTTLIGVSYNNQPMMGIIGQHYELLEPANSEESNQNQGQLKCEFNPIIYFGHSYQDHIYKILGKEIGKSQPIIIQQQQKPNNKDKKISCITSKHHISGTKLSMIQQLKHDTLIQTGGCGRKYVSILTNLADYMIYIGKGMKRWDTCSGEALVKAMGGISSGIFGQIYQYPYTTEESQLQNKEGILSSLDLDLYYEILKQCSQYDENGVKKQQ